MTSNTLGLFAIMMVAGSLVVTGCDTKKEPGAGAAARSAAEPHDDARTDPYGYDSTGGTLPAPAASDVRTYTFHGTTTKIDKATGMITINHEKIGDLMDAMEMPFKVADPALLEDVEVGKNTHFTLRVSGTDMLITNVEDEHAASEGH